MGTIAGHASECNLVHTLPPCGAKSLSNRLLDGCAAALRGLEGEILCGPWVQQTTLNMTENPVLSLHVEGATYLFEEKPCQGAQVNFNRESILPLTTTDYSPGQDSQGNNNDKGSNDNIQHAPLCKANQNSET